MPPAIPSSANMEKSPGQSAERPFMAKLAFCPMRPRPLAASGFRSIQKTNQAMSAKNM